MDSPYSKRANGRTVLAVVAAITVFIAAVVIVIIVVFRPFSDAAAPRPAAPRAGDTHRETAGTRALAELERLTEKVPGFKPVRIAGRPGEVRLTPDRSLTVDDLRGVPLDDDPPVLGPAPAYDPRMADTFAPGEAPYAAEGIAPFRFRFFNCEFNYGGWHTFTMADYAATRGFNIIYPYTRKTTEGRHLPAGTRWLTWGGFVSWHRWFTDHDLPDGRYDLLADRDLVAEHLAAKRFARDPGGERIKTHGDLLMIDQEHPVLSPDKLRAQEWYPRGAPAARRKAFEQTYYDGYAKTYISSARAAREEGWENISIYGWYPWGRTWGGLEKTTAEPGTDFAWNAFGRRIFADIDIVNNSVYCFYWHPGNVAYTLANIDMNIRMTGNRKPVRPYYWTLLHGGGGGWRWWERQPVADEEKRAMIAMGFFTGFDGFVTWNWSGTGNHHRPALRRKVKARDPAPGAAKHRWETSDVMVADGFRCAAEDGTPRRFERYDALHVVSVDDETGTARFQLIDKKAGGKNNHGVGAGYPVYRMPAAALKKHLRAKSAPVAAMIEGMALVKPIEYLLRHGEVEIDVPAQKQFGRRLPVVRRVRLGAVHVLVTYDPNVIYGSRPEGEKTPPADGAPREIVLEDFGGVAGRTLRIPADEHTRLFVVLEEAEAQ